MTPLTGLPAFISEGKNAIEEALPAGPVPDALGLRRMLVADGADGFTALRLFAGAVRSTAVGRADT
jgi:hypothetical protein